MSALGLGDYGSSDDEADETSQSPEQPKSEPAQHTVASRIATAGSSAMTADQPSVRPQQDGDTDTITAGVQNENTGSSAAATTALGPNLPPEVLEVPGPAAAELPEVDPSLSPFSRTRQQVRMLTMPPVPNFEIPPSPPSADPSSAAVANKKIRHFLELKQKGVHFNHRLLSNSALRNPSMTSKLMAFAGIEGVIQYDHAMAEGLGVDVRHWAGLRVEQIVSQMEQARRQEINGRKGKAREFVPASAARHR